MADVAPSGGGVMGELKKIPWWGWVAVGLLIVGVLYARSQSASSSSTTAATGTTGTTTTDTISSADQSTEAAVLAQLQQMQSTQATAGATTTATTGGIPQELLSGAGYWLGPNVETPIQDVNTQKWYQWLSPAAAGSQPGIQRYVQYLPGVFTPVTATTKLAAGTPQFILGGPPIPGYNYGAKVTA